MPLMGEVHAPASSWPGVDDPAARDDLGRSGYFTARLFDADLVDHLYEVCRALVPDGDGDGDGDMFIDYAGGDRSLRAEVNALLNPVFDDVLASVLSGYRVVFSTLAAKPPGPNSSMFLHDDRTFVDEDRHRSLTAWIPLVDTSPELANGCLHVLPGSHLWCRSLSGTSTPDWFAPYSRWLEPHLEPLTLAAGHGVLYDSRLLHASPANCSDRTRLAVLCAIAPEGAPLVHPVGTSPLHRRVHRVEPEFFVDHSPSELVGGMPPDAPVVGERDEVGLAPTPGELAHALGSPTPPVAEPPDHLAARFPAPPLTLPGRSVFGRRSPRQAVPDRGAIVADLQKLAELLTELAPTVPVDVPGLACAVGRPAVPVDEIEERSVARRGRWLACRLEPIADQVAPGSVDRLRAQLATVSGLRQAELTALGPGAVASLGPDPRSAATLVLLPIAVGPGASGAQFADGSTEAFHTGVPVVAAPDCALSVWNAGPWSAVVLVLSVELPAHRTPMQPLRRLRDRRRLANAERRRADAERAMS